MDSDPAAAASSSSEPASSASTEFPSKIPCPKVDGRFKSPYSELPPLGDLLRFMMREKDFSNIPNKKTLDETLPVVRPDLDAISKPPTGKGINATWIGHATVLVQFEGKTILTDPVFGVSAGPIEGLPPRRYRPAAMTIEELPCLDVVLISHNHYDHIHTGSVRKLATRFPAAKWYVPEGTSQLMRDCGVAAANLTELNWWEEATLDGMRFAFLPVQHWTKRTLFDTNKMLWGAWAAIGKENRFFFGGDTAYCPVFKQIGHEYGPFDFAAIPIGAYEPRWFMKNQHVNPEEAVLIHQDIKARYSLGIHWGTFKLTYEPYLEPKVKTHETMVTSGLDPETFFTLKHGESRFIQ